jgi:hypothetical protein
MDGNIKTMADEFKNHIKKEHHVDYPKEILTSVIFMENP